MIGVPTPSNTCICSHNFWSAGALTKHEKTCQRGTKRLADALERAKEVFQCKKCRSTHDPPHSDGDVNSDSAVEGDSCRDVTVQPVSIVPVPMTRPYTFVSWMHK